MNTQAEYTPIDEFDGNPCNEPICAYCAHRIGGLCMESYPDTKLVDMSDTCELWEAF